MHAKDNPSHAPATAPGLSWVHDAAEALLWPRLLRVPALAARPQRLVLSLFLLVLVGVLGNLRVPWRGETPPFLDTILAAKLEALGRLGRALLAIDPPAAIDALAALLVGVPTLAVTHYPLESLLLGIPMALAFAVLAGAVCRSVACEFSQELTLPWARQLGFAVQRWRTLVGAVLLPIGVIAAIAIILAAGGFVCFNIVPGLEVIGAALFGLALLLGLAAVGVLVLSMIAWPLFIPAAACEGADAIDAVGRALAYAIARPVRLLSYLAIAAAVCIAAAVLALALAEGAVAFTQAAATAWTSDRGFAEVYGRFPAPLLDAGGNPEPIGALASTSAWIVGFWCSCLRLLAASFVLSMALTASTLIYLFMRQVCDGQHYAELWTPGRIERAFEAAMGESGAGAPAGEPDDPDD